MVQAFKVFRSKDGMGYHLLPVEDFLSSILIPVFGCIFTKSTYACSNLGIALSSLASFVLARNMEAVQGSTMRLSLIWMALFLIHKHLFMRTQNVLF
jgi:hypothetical protein